MSWVDPNPGSSITADMLRRVRRYSEELVDQQGGTMTLHTISVPAQVGWTLQTVTVQAGLQLDANAMQQQWTWAVHVGDNEGHIIGWDRYQGNFPGGNDVARAGKVGLSIHSVAVEVEPGTPTTFVLVQSRLSGAGSAGLVAPPPLADPEGDGVPGVISVEVLPCSAPEDA